MARPQRPRRSRDSATSVPSKPTRSLRNRQSSHMRASRQRIRESSSEDSADAENSHSSDAVDETSDALTGGNFGETNAQTSSAARRKSVKTRKSNSTTPRPRAKPSPSQKQAKRRVEAQRPSSQAPKRSTPGSQTRPGIPNKKPRIEVCLPVRQGRIPPWTDTRIPYEAWLSIFSYASIGASNGWLVDCATVCKLFLEPALTALYAQPVPATTPKLRRLVELLKKSPSETLINYRNKIEVLSVDIKDTPATQYFPLIHPLTRLKELYIVTMLDRPPYRDLVVNLRWTYPESIFQALKPGSKVESAALPAGQDAGASLTDGDATTDSQSNPAVLVEDFVTPEEKPFATSLRSWEWSGRMLGGAVPTLHDLKKLHKEPFFEHLTTLSFTNFQTPTMLRLANSSAASQPMIDLGDIEAAQAIADSVKQLESLRHLIFEACTMVDHVLLPLLPTNLNHLTLINCWEVRSDIFATFLHTHGRDLVSLTLSHCQSLNLEFLTSLGSACPNLKELSMDLSYYRLHDSIKDSDPMYDYVLLPDQVPDWPSTLRLLSLDNIKDCAAETAKMFLTSLLDNAHRLKDLRYISIKMMLNIPWQDRAKMRTEWRQKMEDVFLRRSDPPIDWTHVTPLVELKDEAANDQKRKSSRPTSPTRRSGRLSSKEPSSRNASKRLRHQAGRLDYRDPDTDHDDVTSSTTDDFAADSDSCPGSGDEDGGSTGAQFIHGMCNSVSILFDNQKPMEMQYGMEDFQDEESTESEEEWNGDDGDDDDSVFVWR